MEIDGQVLSFVFDNILLPDSTANEPSSHGMIKFKIYTDKDIPPLQSILNKAYIYFDFNAPIVTNSTRSVIVEGLDKDSDGSYFWLDCNDADSSIYPTVYLFLLIFCYVTIYPNPTKDIIEIKSDHDITISEVTLTNEMAQQFRFYSMNNMIDVSSLHPGIYFIKIISGNLSLVKKVVIR